MDKLRRLVDTASETQAQNVDRKVGPVDPSPTPRLKRVQAETLAADGFGDLRRRRLILGIWNWLSWFR